MWFHLLWRVFKVTQGMQSAVDYAVNGGVRSVMALLVAVIREVDWPHPHIRMFVQHDLLYICTDAVQYSRCISSCPVRHGCTICTIAC